MPDIGVDPRPRFDVLAGGGELGALMRGLDWSATALGPPDNWPHSLRAAVRIMLTSRQPIWIGWGRDLTYMYNDAYKSIIGGRHPWALGKPTAEVWKEIWPEIEPMLASAMGDGEGTYVEGQLLIMERNGYPEETYYTFSYSPIPDDEGAPGGIICANSEDTARVVGQRQLALLSELGSRAVGARSGREACELSAAALGTNPRDIPFAAIYISPDGTADMELIAACGIEPGHALAPSIFPSAGRYAGQAIDPATLTGPRLIEGIGNLVDAQVSSGEWALKPQQAALFPLEAAGLNGLLLVGISPVRLFNHEYSDFLSLVASQIGNAIARADAYESERKRAEALAEIDRAKTIFFSNVSHEFRTPLTLMLGPLEELLDGTDASARVHDLVDVAHRNGLRLLRLVNTLLDFARIEAGRAEARYTPVNISELTADLASNFRAACERAGLILDVDCPDLGTPVHVDGSMWEKIVLNLLSNAFKYTLGGGIRVSLRRHGDRVELRVADSGVGIPEAELPRLFDRFHRIEGQQGRTQEGSGIGLALVEELVHLHGGSITAESRLGEGSCFIVSLPIGTDHLPADRVVTRRDDRTGSAEAEALVEEALRWLPEDKPEQHVSNPDLPDAGHILIADDNADMRDHISRLLTPLGFTIETAGDGEQAIEAIRARRPDLLLSDVMMPKLDGFGLLKALRDDAALRDLPVIMLSARAGEEARIDGIAAGADDYLTKPFAGRELIARVQANLTAARLRKATTDEVRASELRLRRLFEEAPGFIAILRGPDLMFEFVNRSYARLFGEHDYIGRRFADIFADGGATRLMHQVYGSGERQAGTAATVPITQDRTVTVDYVCEPVRDAQGVVTGVFLEGHDVSDRYRAERALRELNETLERRIAEAVAEREAVTEALRQAQKMEAVGQLTGGVAHDFNNLLTIITGNMDMVRRSLDRGDTGRAIRAVDNAQKGAERAASLTQRLLAFSRRQPLDPKPIDIDRLVLGMSDLLNRALGETIRLEIVTNPGLWKVEADPNQLENCLLNLAVNARDAMPEGGKLTIETANARLDESYSAAHAEVASGNYVMIAVSDTGTGMPKEVLERVFEPFFTTKEVGRGTGLGLSMVYGFTKQSGGHVKLYSEEGSGTTIKIYLPHLLRDDGVEEEQVETLPGGEGHDEVILVTEDDDDVRAYTVDILRELGYHVIEAHDGPAALRHIEKAERPIDLLFTDVVMPGMSGQKLVEQARLLRPDLKVLYTSGYTRNAIVHNGRLDAGVEMIAKPFTYQALSGRIRDLLDVGASRNILLVDGDAGRRISLGGALSDAGHKVDEAATEMEALGKLRAAGGAYRAVIIGGGLPERRGAKLVREVRAMHLELPILLSQGDDQLRALHAGDRCTHVLDEPYSPAAVLDMLAELATCGKAATTG